MSEPLITVCIPTYNRAKLLKETISSVLAQSLPDFQLIICDNASTDDTREAVSSFQDSRIQYHRHAENLGLKGNWRFALTHPRTRYVALTSDDDLYLPNHLESALAQLETNPQATLYACGTEIFGAPGKAGPYGPDWLLKLKGLTCFSPRGEYFGWLCGCPVTSCSVLIRRSAVEQIAEWGGATWPTSLDWLWWGQLAIFGDFIFDPAIGCRYRYHQSNETYAWIKSGVAGIENRYTIRTLAQLAYRRGCFTPEELVRDALQRPSASVSALVAALASRDTAPALRKAAFEIWRQHPTVRTQPASSHTRIAAIVGSWYLSYGDRLHRLRHRWPPKEKA